MFAMRGEFVCERIDVISAMISVNSGTKVAAEGGYELVKALIGTIVVTAIPVTPKIVSAAFTFLIAAATKGAISSGRTSLPIVIHLIATSFL